MPGMLDARARAHGDEQWIDLAAELFAGLALELGDALVDLFIKAVGELPAEFEDNAGRLQL